MKYTWNDIIDPNPDYASDTAKAEFAKKISFANPKDYIIRISWSDKSIIKENHRLLNRNSGWLNDFGEHVGSIESYNMLCLFGFN